MALVQCKECKKEVSDKAKLCPHCGVDSPQPYTGMSFSTKLYGLLLVSFFGLIAYGMFSTPNVKNLDNQKKEIVKVEKSSNILYDDAKKQFDNKEFSSSIVSFKNLISTFPSSNEANLSKELIIMAEQEIKKEQEINDAIIERDKKARNERIAKANLKMHIKIDDIAKIEWHSHKDMVKEFNTNMQLYFGKPFNDAPYLRLKTTYHGDSWLFVRSMIIVADGVQYPFNKIKFERDHKSSVWEWNDMLIDGNLVYMIDNIIESKKVVVRFEGDKYFKDYTLTKKEIQCLKEVLEAFNSYKG